MSVEGKVCMIVGGTAIAAATLRMAAAAGARVFLAGTEAAECRALAAATGCDFHAGNLRDPDFAEMAAGLCVARFGRIDALFNAHGSSGRRYGDGPVDQCTEEGWDVTLAANIKPVFLFSRAVLPHMLQARRGAILNLASVLAFSPEPERYATHAYAAAKGAVIALSKSMAAYYAPEGIRVNALAPALVGEALPDDPELAGYMERKQPLTRGIIAPEDVARAALFLLSDEARAITGQVFAIDAGWSVR